MFTCPEIFGYSFASFLRNTTDTARWSHTSVSQSNFCCCLEAHLGQSPGSGTKVKSHHPSLKSAVPTSTLLLPLVDFCCSQMCQLCPVHNVLFSPRWCEIASFRFFGWFICCVSEVTFLLLFYLCAPKVQNLSNAHLCLHIYISQNINYTQLLQCYKCYNYMTVIQCLFFFFMTAPVLSVRMTIPVWVTVHFFLAKQLRNCAEKQKIWRKRFLHPAENCPYFYTGWQFWADRMTWPTYFPLNMYIYVPAVCLYWKSSVIASLSVSTKITPYSLRGGGLLFMMKLKAKKNKQGNRK